MKQRIPSVFLFAALFALTAPAANAETAGENVTEARPVLARPSPNGGISLGGAELFVAAFAPGWKVLPVKADPSPPGGEARPFEIRGEQTFFKGTTEWRPQSDGTLRGRIELECVVPVEMQCVAVAANIPAPPPFGLGDASAATFELPLSDGRTTRLTFPQSVDYHAQDSRPWGGQWTVRFAGHLGHAGTRAFAQGERLAWEMTLSAPDGIEMADDKPHDVVPGDEWVRLDNHKDVAPGSALDFSGQGLQDAPAGKHGWLKAVDGHFEFEGLPGVEQRFYGANLCHSANFPDHDLADRLVDRLVRCGYNTVRIHHHDVAWSAAYAAREGGSEGSGAEPPSIADDDIDKLDYLLAKCFERGLYVTTDLYVSRPVAWREIGIDRDGAMNMQLYKTYVGIHDGAFTNWCRWAQAFLEHVNPYTGRAYKDEPGMPFVSLVNEGKLSMSWGGAGKALDPVVRAAWREFGGDGDDPPGSGANTPDSPHDRFDAWINRRIWERCSAFVRSLGCRALLTNDNNGRWHGEGEGLVPLYDYVDNHFYVDHPVFLDQPWRLPSKCLNANPIQADLPALLHRGYAKGASKPYAISEWNFSGPGRYRGMGGLLTGALAAEQDWDALWRFAYAHRVRFLPDDGKSGPNYFDCATDPLIAASDRAAVCLFLRGDAQEATSDERRVTSGGLHLDKDLGTLAIDTPRTCGGFAESGRVDAGPLSFELVGGSGAEPPLSAVPTTLWASSLDGAPISASSRILLTHLTDVQGEGTRYADNSRTVLLKWGGAPLVEAGAALVELRFDPREGRAGCAGNDGAADAVNDDGARQMTNEDSVIAAEGGSSLRGGAAPVIAAEGGPVIEDGGRGTPAVFALDTAGQRTGVVPSRFEDGVLRFRVCTCGPDGGRIYYEIARQP